MTVKLAELLSCQLYKSIWSKVLLPATPPSIFLLSLHYRFLTTSLNWWHHVETTASTASASPSAPASASPSWACTWRTWSPCTWRCQTGWTKRRRGSTWPKPSSCMPSFRSWHLSRPRRPTLMLTRTWSTSSRWVQNGGQVRMGGAGCRIYYTHNLISNGPTCGAMGCNSTQAASSRRCLDIGISLVVFSVNYLHLLPGKEAEVWNLLLLQLITVRRRYENI